MKKKLQILSFLVTLSFFSCGGTEKNPGDTISNIETDFPVSEKLEFKFFNKYAIFEKGNCMIEDSVLWHFGTNEHEQSHGYCYDLNTGAKLSMIVSKGHAAYEITSFGNFYDCKIIGDSIQVSPDINAIKIFSKKDILENKPMNERKFSIMTVPDSINVRKMIKLPNGSIVATLGVTRDRENSYKSIAMFNGGKVDSYETIKYDSFDIKIPESEFTTKDVILNAYSHGFNGIKGNELAVFSVKLQFILYTFDLKTGNVVNEKRYTKMQGDGMPMSLFTTNDRDMDITYMKSNDKYIYCTVGGYFSEKDKKEQLRTRKIFVFDWDLNPIKCFDLPNGEIDNLIISEDCSSVYLGNHTEEGYTLMKADLNM